MGLVTVTSLAMTYIEGARRDRDWDFCRVTGIVLCFLWPVLVPLLILAAVFSSFGFQKRMNAISLGREKRWADTGARNEEYPAVRVSAGKPALHLPRSSWGRL